VTTLDIFELIFIIIVAVGGLIGFYKAATSENK